MSRIRWVAAVAVLVVTCTLAPGPSGAISLSAAMSRSPRWTLPAPSVGLGTMYRSPVDQLRVLRPFQPPRTQYGPGHRGVDLALAAGGLVRAAATGVVSFAGPVAGRGVVVVLHPDGIRTEYEPVAAAVQRGAAVAAGQTIGTLRGLHAGCAGPCLHWGARRGEVYIDPLGLLRPLGPVRLLPWR
ncbi:MAG: M23 family metallopeptidase [bacterium]